MHTHIKLPQEIDEVLPSKATGCCTADKGLILADGYTVAFDEVKVGDAGVGADGRVAYIIGLYYEVLRAFKLTTDVPGQAPYFINAEHLLPIIHQKERIKKLVSAWDWYNMTPKEQANWRLYKIGVPYYRGAKDDLKPSPYMMGYKYYGLDFMDAPGLGFTSLPSLHPYQISTVINRLQFLAGLMDAKGMRTPTGYKFDTYYPPLASTILKICWSLGMEATENISSIGLHHIRITEDSKLLIPSRKYQTVELADNLEDKISLCHSLHKFSIEDTGEYLEFYGICTNGKGYYLLDDFTCAYHCEPVTEEEA